jgi:hypothetical protein
MNWPFPFTEGLTVVPAPLFAGFPVSFFETNDVCSVPAQPAAARGPRPYIWFAEEPKFAAAEAKATKHPSSLIDGESLGLSPATEGIESFFETRMV